MDSQLLRQIFATATGTSRDIQNLQQRFETMTTTVEKVQRDLYSSRDYTKGALNEATAARREVETMNDEYDAGEQELHVRDGTSFPTEDARDTVSVCELQELEMIDNTGVGLGEENLYSKAWRGKERGRQILHSSPEESYKKLPSYCHMLTEGNPGTIAHIELDPNNRFYFFLAFGPSIRGFREHIRSVICVDGRHLKGWNKGTLLLAAAQDANMQIYPIAWDVVDEETNVSWYWFFMKLKDIVNDSNQPVFVSDKKNSIKRPITMLFPLSHHGACIWHIEKNLIARYSSPNVIFLFKSAALAYRVLEFQQMMRQIRTIRPAVPSYLERDGPSTWSPANFVGNRYNIMTNDIAESLNSVLKRQRSFPITSFIQHITTLMQQWFFEQRNASTNYHTALASKMEGELRQSFDASATLDIQNLDELVSRLAQV
ncbi:uncharacterized protein LOC111366966 [Olea europaea var. sylvestris]|uniref:uncharacterized protein LOC111366966 n=1 Tax=Olea europaea var. sylvestris TaxID=158386 RepID=UPI000C1CFC61|nr:uncharacterized protein LOC111366966 [Olea europaea var. sylvestris]